MSPIIENPITAVPQHKLRRLAMRALRVLERHASKHQAIASVGPRLKAAATGFIAGYDSAKAAAPVRARELRQGYDQARALSTVMGRWTALLASDVASFDIKVFASRPDVPDDVMSAAERLIALVEAYVDDDGNPLSYKDELVSEVQAALATTAKEWEEGQQVKAELQEAQSQVRQLAGELQAQLVVLRRTLRAVLGSKHADYQKLRLNRASQMDEEDGEVVEGVAELGDPAPLVVDTATEGEEDAAE